MIKVNVEKAKDIAHAARRQKRDVDFQPIDGGAMYASLNQEGQEQREVVKAADDQLQADIDAAVDAEELLTLVKDKSLL